MLVRYPGFRQYEKARIGANDAMMALLLSSRLSRHSLSLHTGSTIRLPEIFPLVPDIERLDRTVEDAQDLIASAERHFAYMAIPYALSVYGELVVDALRLVAIDGRYNGPPKQLTGGKIHGEFERATGRQLPAVESMVYDYCNSARNRVIHHAGKGSDELVKRFAALGPTAIAWWTKRSGRHLIPSGPNIDLVLEAPELIAVLALTQRLASIVNHMLQDEVSAETWALVVAKDYRDCQPRKWNDLSRRMRSVIGFARQNYKALALSEADLADAVSRVLAED